MEKFYCILVSCDPYNAKFHYHGEPVVRYDGKTPISWVSHSFLTLDEAFDILQGLSSEFEIDLPEKSTFLRYDTLSYAICGLEVTLPF